ncbi:hypothetical protein [Nonomuraea sp. NPDC052265]|uniref:hypothetical protein n=1 Tax=Nonomuraea sp. NPDC052265 TaxID=3364374 RepID=UPI0037C9F743
MDVEAEILDIKLRVQALEATLCAEADCSEAVLGIAELRADLADTRSEAGHHVTALTDELLGLHGQSDEHFQAVRSKIRRRLDLLRCETLDLAIRLDRLLERDGS